MSNWKEFPNPQGVSIRRESERESESESERERERERETTNKCREREYY